ncbi:MAG TPA: NAD(P)/FAD-dependent oxidoreductase [Acidimicrobiales bacterium]|nr:NAD(P)/FAD-dependent oxidoreductase [Acidimicrobiales bacterium]
MPDVIVIGAGPNGLVAANRLADRGWSVLVCEAADRPGGAVKSSELIEPGFVNDEFSAFYPLAAASPVIRRLNLEDHGLRWRRAPLVLAHPGPDGSCPVVSTNLDVTVESLERLMPGDGEAWRRLYELYEQVRPGILGALFTPFPPLRAGLRLVGALRPSELLRFARFATLPARTLAEEEFAGEAGRRLLAGNALHADFAPETALGGFFGWLMMSLAQSVGFPVPEGGAGNLIAALVRRLEAKGATLRCGTPVRRIVIRKGRAVAVETADGTQIDATMAVVADVTAPALYRDLVGLEHLPRSVADDLERFHWDLATVKVDWTLDGPIPWEAEPARRAGTLHLVDNVDQLTMICAQYATGHIPARPFLLVGQQSMSDHTRQPAGKETAWAYTHVPMVVRGDAGGDLTGSWDEGEVDVFAKRMEDEIERLAPGFRALIRGRHVFSPHDLAAANSSLVGGAIAGGTAQLHQQLVFRPTPGLARPETHIRGLYLGSASAHPGGGVHGAPGSNAARAVTAGVWRRRLGLPR